MGHTTLGVLPKTRHWKTVVEMLAGPHVPSAVIAASARAAEKDLLNASSDAVYVEAVHLLLSIPAAARQEDFGDALRQLDLRVRQQPELLDIIVAVTKRLDSVAVSRSGRNDLGELAGRALASTLSTLIGDGLPGLFEATPADVQEAARRLSWNQPVAAYTRHFFSTLTAGVLSYWLDRTLDMEIGDTQRFSTLMDRSAFDTELHGFAWEASRIIKEFSGGWYGKTLHRDGGFSTSQAASFGHVALKKIVDDLRTREFADA